MNKLRIALQILPAAEKQRSINAEIPPKIQ
jgi:hypothetical protein